MKYTGMEWIVIDTPIQLKEVSSIATPLADKLKLYAKDKAGVSALYYKDDAGNEKDLSGGLTGSGTANRLAYWTSTTVLAANAALTQNHILVADVNGLPTGNASAQITNLTGDVALTLKGTTNGLLKIDGAATGNPYIEWAQNGTFKGRFQYLDADDSLALSVNGAERFRFGSAGQLGIGGATYGTAGYLFKSGGASATPTWTAPASVTAGSSKITLGGTPTNAALIAFSIDVNQANLDHGSIGGLTDDDHTGYALLAGRSGGQTLIGGTGSSDVLSLKATSHGDGTKLSINSVSIASGSDIGAAVEVAPTFTGAATAMRGFRSLVTFQPTAATLNAAISFIGFAVGDPAAGKTIALLAGLAPVYQTGSNGGAVTSAYSLYIPSPTIGSVKPTNSYGTFIENHGAASMTNAVGLHIAAQSGATNNYDMGFGTVDTTAAGAYYGRVPVLYNGLLKYLHLFSA